VQLGWSELIAPYMNLPSNVQHTLDSLLSLASVFIRRILPVTRKAGGGRKAVACRFLCSIVEEEKAVCAVAAPAPAS
jgi:hypothetical protein